MINLMVWLLYTNLIPKSLINTQLKYDNTIEKPEAKLVKLKFLNFLGVDNFENR